MNTQYRYFEQALTPSIAQELIQELFAGQTAQKQEIIRVVGAVHLERGGLAPEDPVTTALSTMKESGLAENLENDLWSIPPEAAEEVGIKTLNEFTDWVQKSTSEGSMFRGVENERYRIQASAYRRPKEEDRSFKKFLHINEDLIDRAILRGYDERNGRVFKHLEILAELQHYGAATCLIDFTYNALVALWFACQPDSKTRDSERQPNGKVFAVFNEPRKFKKIDSNLLEKNIDHFLQDDENYQLYHWTPRQQNNRIIAQQSVFLFGRAEFDADKECIIAGKNKKSILDELEQVLGINESMLFPDFNGFARLCGHEIPYVQLLDYEYKEHADKQFLNEEYEKSIDSCDRAIDLNPDYVDAYYRRGLAEHHLGKYEAAISDFNVFIERNPDYEAYYYRAESYSHLGHLDEAREDLQVALPLSEEAGDEEFMIRIEELLYYIDSRTAREAQDE